MSLSLPAANSAMLCTSWDIVKEFCLSYHNIETVLSTIDPYYGNLKQS